VVLIPCVEIRDYYLAGFESVGMACEEDANRADIGTCTQHHNLRGLSHPRHHPLLDSPLPSVGPAPLIHEFAVLALALLVLIPPLRRGHPLPNDNLAPHIPHTRSALPDRTMRLHLQRLEYGGMCTDRDASAVDARGERGCGDVVAVCGGVVCEGVCEEVVD